MRASKLDDQPPHLDLAGHQHPPSHQQRGAELQTEEPPGRAPPRGQPRHVSRHRVGGEGRPGQGGHLRQERLRLRLHVRRVQPRDGQRDAGPVWPEGQDPGRGLQ